MIVKVSDEKSLQKFVDFTKKHYKGDKLYAPPLYNSLYKSLYKRAIANTEYTALLCVKDGEVVGRLLYTVGTSKRAQRAAGFFSMFECIDDIGCAKELFDCMEGDLKSKGIYYAEGSYTPYDPDNNLGILVEGFDSAPMIFTSYNYPYYGSLMEKLGYVKGYDKYSLRLDIEGAKAEELKELADAVRKKLSVRVDNLDYGNFDRDADDVAEIFKAATSELNFHEAPSIDTIKKVALSMKAFLIPEFIKIAREKDTDKPIGFCMSIPDFNQVIRKTDGKIRPLTMLVEKKKITSARGMLQYVIPEYQGVGLIAVLFDETYKSFKKHGITYFEGGTILEENKKSWGILQKFGGETAKIYRIYKKEF